jgi:endonuclease/exonuclease/phosphatase family metal-dependent hydrolase
MPSSDTRLRVMTWNLWWQYGPWEQRQPAIALTMTAIDADIICIQEVWSTPDQNQAAELANLLDFDHAYASRVELDGVEVGNAVLSRWPIEYYETMPLPAADHVQEFRLCLRADIDGPEGPLQVFSTHLNWRFDQSDVRQEQVHTIARFVDGSPERDYPPILCGDFNATPDSDEIRMLTGRSKVPVPKLVFLDAWEAAVEREGPTEGFTWDNKNTFALEDHEPSRRIDYVFVGWPRDGGRGHVVSCQVVNEPVEDIFPSDHAAVVAELRY